MLQSCWREQICYIVNRYELHCRLVRNYQLKLALSWDMRIVQGIELLSVLSNI
jgi:hypothetical protein